MSVKIRLNNKKFLGEGLVIGSRLNEEGEVINNQQQTNQQQVGQQQVTQQPQQMQFAQQQVQSGAQQQSQQQNSSNNDISEQLDQIIANSFVQLAGNIANQIGQIKLPEGATIEWVKADNIKQGKCETVIPAVQKFLQENINKAKESVQKYVEAFKTNNASTENSSAAQ